MTCTGKTFSGAPCKQTAKLDEDGRCTSHPKRRCQVLAFGSPCGARIRASDEACPKHIWALDEAETTKRANAVLAEIGRQEHAVEFARRQLSELSVKIRLAETKLEEAEKAVVRMLDKRKDAELLTNAESLNPEAQDAIVSLVRERRMQRSEAANPGKKSNQFHRHVDAEWDP